MNKLLEFLQEDNGGFSATRLAFLVWSVGVRVVWIIESLTSQVLARIATILDILMTGKVIQEFGEKPDVFDSGNPPVASTPTPGTHPQCVRLQIPPNDSATSS